MLPAFELPCQVSNLTWVDSITSRRDDIRCRLELKCQLQSNVKPRINNWLCCAQLDGIKEQRRNGNSPLDGRVRSWKVAVLGRECRGFSPGRRLRRSESHDLLRTVEDKEGAAGTSQKVRPLHPRMWLIWRYHNLE